MRSQLPPGQTRILTFFADAEDNGRQPSRAEVAVAMGYAFPSAVSKHVEALERKGLLVADRDKKRNVRLTEAGWASIGRAPARQGVPVIGQIAAGTPILATENRSGFLTDVKPAPGRIALKVRGDSMINAGILDGDFAVIQSGGDVPNGHIGAVVVDGEATLKRVVRHADRLELIAENPAYPPRVIPLAQSEQVQVVGPLSFIYRTVT
jgi:repressor LexA